MPTHGVGLGSRVYTQPAFSSSKFPLPNSTPTHAVRASHNKRIGYIIKNGQCALCQSLCGGSPLLRDNCMSEILCHTGAQ